MENILKGEDVLKGVAAGVAGVAVMHYGVTPIMYKFEDEEAFRREKEAQPFGLEAPHVLAYKMAGRESKALGKLNELFLGIAPAIIYKRFYRDVPFLTMGKGLLFGFLGFALVDELLVPASGLAGPHRKYPWQAHARGLVGHLAYGLAIHAAVSFLDRKKT